VITLTKPPEKLRNTTNVKRPSNVSPNAMYLARSPDLVVAGEDFLHFFRGELVPLDTGDILIVPLKAGCIYKMLQGQGVRLRPRS
jgi:hypothetical protein